MDPRKLMEQELRNAERVGPPAPLPPDGVVLVNGADLTPQPVSWLWHHWLAQGKLHILAGAPGQGKTTIAMSLAATVTRGGMWPDGSRCEAGNVLIWSGEDDPGDTLLPRLLAAGANRARVFFVTGAQIGGKVHPFDPARDMAKLLATIERIGQVHMIVVDPIVSAVTGDSHKNTEVRRDLQPLVDLAAATNAVLLGITHFAKGGKDLDPSERVLGSVAFTAVSRVVMVAAKVKSEDGEDRRILARSKSNIGPDDGGVSYSLENCEPLPNVHTSRVVWGELVQGSARDLLAVPNDQDDGDMGKTAIQHAEDYLRQVLADGPTPTDEVKRQALEAGLAWRTVRRAADNLLIIRKKGLGDASHWYWQLPKPPTTHQVVQLVQPESVDTLAKLDTDATPTDTNQHEDAETE